MPIAATFYLCEFCDEVFENEAKCIHHERNRHPTGRRVETSNVATMVDLDLVDCPPDLTAKCGYDEQKHMSFEVSESAITTKNEPIVFASDQSFLDILGSQELDLNSAAIKQEVIKAKKKFPCPMCRKEYGSEHGLYIHKMVTHENRIHRCKICDKSFTQLHNLKAHQRKEHEDKDARFPCKICGKLYSQASAVYRHMRAQHLGVRYMCRFCNLNFKHRETYMQHMSRMHNTTGSREDIIKDESLTDFNTNIDYNQDYNIESPIQQSLEYNIE